MTTATITGYSPSPARQRERRFIRLVRAELLKLRRRRGLLAFTAALTIVPMIIGYTITIYLHASDPAGNGPAGGVANLGGGLGILSLLGSIAAVLVGATLGSSDLGAGVFRDLVVTGRSRTALFLARIPAGLAILSAFVVPAFLIATIVAVTEAGSTASPTSSLVLSSAGWIAITIVTTYLVALGVSSALGSRSMSIGVLLGWQLGLAKLLVAISFIGVIREGLLPTGVDHFTPSQLDIAGQVSTPAVTAVIVILTWPALALAAGAWRTTTRDV